MRADIAQLQTLNFEAREQGWWDNYGDDISENYPNYIGFEAGAVSIRQFQLAFVPGLLQTAEYAEAIAVNSVDIIRTASTAAQASAPARTRAAAA